MEVFGSVKVRWLALLLLAAGAILILAASLPAIAQGGFLDESAPNHPWDQQVRDNTRSLIDQGRQTFRYDTFGSETFFGNTIGLHQAIEGSKFPGGVGGGVSPATALKLGLKVDMDALPAPVVQAVQAGQVNLNDPAVTLTLLQLGAVVGVQGIFNDPNDTSKGLKAVGITCALCHSTVDDAFAPGIGHRLDGWANQDLNVGGIVAAAPNLQPVADLLNKGLPPDGQVDVPTVVTVLNSWGPGRFDAELFLDGKAFGPGMSNASTLIPDAFGLAGVNAHTWTGNWGTVTYWNAFVANLEMHGTPGNFFDTRLDDKTKYPVAAAIRDGHVQSPPGEDRISPKLPALQYYQLSMPTPKPVAGKDFNAEAAARGQVIFNGRGQCATCHVPPTFSEPGWNLHAPADIGLDDASGRFEADRSPDGKYVTAPLAGRLFKRTRGFFHDGRFATLMDVVNHFDSFMKLGLSDADKSDLVEYLKSI
jgi:cytochrome c5